MPKIVGIPLQFHIFELKVASRPFSAYRGDQILALIFTSLHSWANPPQKSISEIQDYKTKFGMNILFVTGCRITSQNVVGI